MDAKGLERFVKGPKIWQEYYELLAVSGARVSRKLTRLLKDPRALKSGAQQRAFFSELDKTIKSEMSRLEALLIKKESTVSRNLKAKQNIFVKTRAPSVSTSFTAGTSATSAKVIARADTQLSGFFEKKIKETSTKMSRTVKAGIRDAKLKIKAGTLEGMPVDSIVTDIKQNVLGVAPGKKVKGLTANLRTEVSTNVAATNYDILNEFGKSQEDIIGVIIERGPGACPSNVCGEALGVSEGQTATFIYGKNDPPSPPFHPNCYCAVIGFVFADQKNTTQQVSGAKRHFDNKVKGNPIYEGFATGRKAGAEAIQANKAS
jgi:hypothetical protein